MRNRYPTIIVLTVLMFFLLGTSLAYWPNKINVPEDPLSKQGDVSIKAEPPSGGNEFDNKPGSPDIKYEKGDVFYDEDSNTIFEVVDGCGQTKGCPKPDFTTPPNNSKFKAMTHLWVRSTKYYDNDVVIQDGRAFKVYNYGMANNPTGVPNEQRSGWIELSSLDFHADYYYPTGSLLIVDQRFYRLKSGSYPGVEFPTLGPGENWAYIEYFNYIKDRKEQYKLDEGVLYNGDAYIVNNEVNANKNYPGTIGGGWQKVGSLLWEETNIYNVNDIVKHKNSGQNDYRYYRAVANNITAEPNTTTGTWSSLETKGYQEFNTYLEGQYMIFGNDIYKAIKVVSGIKPTDPTGELYWKKI